jgi:hypothetical protein
MPSAAVDTALKIVAWMAYGSVFLVAVYQIASMMRVWNTLRTLRKRAMRFRVLMALFSASRFGEIGLELFGSPVGAPRPREGALYACMQLCGGEEGAGAGPVGGGEGDKRLR